jgi:hypothetical protein
MIEHRIRTSLTIAPPIVYLQLECNCPCQLLNENVKRNRRLAAAGWQRTFGNFLDGSAKLLTLGNGMLSRRLMNKWLAAALVIQGANIAGKTGAQPQAATTATARRFELPVSVTWQGQQLGPGLDRLAELQQVTVWLDRRVDPSTSVDFSASNRPLLAVFRELAAPRGWSASPVGSVVYFGPAQTADELNTLAAMARQQAARTPAAMRGAWLKSERWSFPRLSQPRELLEGLAKSAGASVIKAELVPLDLWPARSLPPMPVIDRVVLVLSGFDLTCELSADGRRLTVVPIKRPVQISREYAIPTARATEIERLLAAMPAVKGERRGQRLVVSARVEQHDELTAALRGETKPAAQSSPPMARPETRLADQRFTLRIENQPVGAVIDQLAKQLGLEVTWDQSLPTAGTASRKALASCEVREASLDGLLKAVLAPAQLTFQRDGQKVSIRAAN